MRNSVRPFLLLVVALHANAVGGNKSSFARSEAVGCFFILFYFSTGIIDLLQGFTTFVLPRVLRFGNNSGNGHCFCDSHCSPLVHKIMQYIPSAPT